ncbi:hypothetical protein DESUT3_04130 [Desulfuromonas versatilis]|uniref:DUF58 domain-containing protein n=1 Tax=Desulfuromonas versatilis TaxID=2802975 RepID=A0ABM8HRV6_9BACT|nr:DUF58 domain-containing protein [Desulfuromonas versatilis]BCR03344.1 hypothetical protein DESUT3_04130 [Desulfuromonas versatilis]
MTLLLGFGAVNTGNNLLYLLVSALLGFMSISGILGQQNLARLRVRVEVPEEVYDGLPTLVTLHLENPRRYLPAFLITISLRGQSTTLPLVDRGGSDAGSILVAFRGRGRHRLEPVRVSSIFPINFFVRSRLAFAEGQVTVFPAPLALAAGSDSGRPAARGAAPTPSRGHEGEVSRISDYRGGEPLKLIHWKLSARHDQLKVKELSAATHEPLIIDLERLPGADLEQRLGCAVHLVRETLRRERPVGLRLGSRLIPPAAGRHQRLKLLTELALYGQD